MEPIDDLINTQFNSENMMPQSKANTDFKKSSCILCSINCGLDIKTGGIDGRELIKIKGDRDNPSSQGYVCNKAARLNHYQMGADRISSPMRRKTDGTYESVDWDTAIQEVAAGLNKVKQQYGGDKILFLGGGGQGNHLGGIFNDGLQKTLGIKYRSNALAQEKTGEFWVNGKMFGGGPHGDFENAEVAVFLGKNPWQSHGFPQTRKVLKEISKDPSRCMIVIDPCVTDTAKISDFHLQVKPGTDAWAVSAMIAVVIQEKLFDETFITNHTEGFEEIRVHFENLSITEYSEISHLDEQIIRNVSRRIASAKSVSIFEDLGVQQNINSTLVSYLQKILWVITGNFAKKGTANIGVPLMGLTDLSKGKISSKDKTQFKKVTPVLGSKIISGLMPCNEIADEIMTAHPNRFRAVIIESSNPVHSYAESTKMREAIRSLEFSVVIDVAMTETAREASYILPAASSFEKHECVFFQVDFPKNTFQLRHPIVEPLKGTLIEAEIHTRLVEELGGIKKYHVALLKTAAKIHRKVFALVFLTLLALKPQLMKIAPSLMFRTLGTTLDKGRAAAAAPFWALCHQFVRNNPRSAANAGFSGSRWKAGEKLFDTLIKSPSGFVFSDSGTDYSDSWNRMGRINKRIKLHIEELFPQVCDLDINLLSDSKEFPFVLTAGQRRGETANTIIRDPSWDRKGKIASLYVHSKDAEKLDLQSGDNVRITTKTGSAQTYVEINDMQQPGFVSLPNGIGLDYLDKDGIRIKTGIAPNDLTSNQDKDFFAGTPWHKYVRAKIEKISKKVTEKVA